MKKNISGLGRIIRLIVAIALAIIVATGVVEGVWAIVLGIVAVVMLLTGAIGFCPLFAITGTSCPLKRKD